MLSRTIYVCEICGTEHTSEADALACEAYGLPEPMPFLPLGERIPAFGANGIEWATIEEVDILSTPNACNPFGHRWVVVATPHLILSHKRDGDQMVPATAFDPRHGYDAFRYGATLADVAVWSATLRRYGFTEADATRYVRDNVRQGLRTVAVGCDTVSALDVVIYEMKDRAATMLQASNLGFAASGVLRADWAYLRSWRKETAGTVANEAVGELDALLAMVEDRS